MDSSGMFVQKETTRNPENECLFVICIIKHKFKTTGIQ
jgi:hypothetical protein